MRRCPRLAGLLPALLLLGAAPAHALVIGLDARNGQPNDNTADPTGGFLASGSDYESLRAQLQGEGYTLVSVSDFSFSNLASLGIDSLWLSHPYFASNASPGNGASIQVGVSAKPGTRFDHLILMRRTATTHLIDGDQRGVVLPVSVHPLTGAITATIPGTSVVPPGKYMLFANTTALDGTVVPSVGASISIEANPCAPE